MITCVKLDGRYQLKNDKRFIVATLKMGEKPHNAEFKDAFASYEIAYEYCLSILVPEFKPNTPVPFITELPPGWLLLELHHVH